jgi:hypothetical protein
LDKELIPELNYVINLNVVVGIIVRVVIIELDRVANWDGKGYYATYYLTKKDFPLCTFFNAFDNLFSRILLVVLLEYKYKDGIVD